MFISVSGRTFIRKVRDYVICSYNDKVFLTTYTQRFIITYLSFDKDAYNASFEKYLESGANYYIKHDEPLAIIYIEIVKFEALIPSGMNPETFMQEHKYAPVPEGFESIG